MRRCTIPEGVEVKISSELIRPWVVGKLITKISVGERSRYASKLPEGLKEFSDSFKSSELGGWVNSPALITGVKTKGKFMYWTFDNNWYMFSTFGMSGQWASQAGKHVCLHVGLHDPRDIDGAFSNVYFNDPRHFGTIKFSNRQKDLTTKLAELGWDPLHDSIETWLSYLTKAIQQSNKPIGELLMKQKLFAGVGNYIRAEALYLAKISPWRLGNKLTVSEIEILCKSLVLVMKESYNYQGATIHTYKDPYGNEGRYSSCFKVYGQKKDPLGNIIIKETTPDNRSIHWCPTIQI